MSKKTIFFLGDPHLTSRAPRSRIDDYPETCRRKLAYACKRAAEEKGILILAGDVFHTPVQTTAFVNSIIRTIKKSKARVFTIVGNHDVVNYNYAKILDTSLGSLIVSGTVPLLKSIKIGKWEIVNHAYGESFNKITPSDDHPFLIVVSHSFYETSHTDKMNIEKWEVEESEAAMLLLGHDHVQYPITYIEDTCLVRPGSMTRATSHTCNYSRTPAMAKIIIDTVTGEFNVEFEDLPHLPASEVYLLQDDADTGVDSFDDVRSLIDEIKNSGGSTSPFEVLDSMGLPAEVYDLCVDYMHAVGVFRNEKEALESVETA